MPKLILFLPLFLLTHSLISQFQWTHTDGPIGINRGPLSANDHYAFVPGGGDFFFRTSDGWHWEKLDFDATDYLYVYKDTLINPDYVNDESIMHVSVDNGSSWITKNLPPKVSTLSSFALTPFGLFAQDWDHLLYVSTDLGDTWDTIAAPTTGYFKLTLIDDWLYISTGKGMWRSADGENWHEIVTPLEPINLEYLDDFIAKDSHIVIISESFLFYSHDLGESWQQHDFYSAFHYDKMCLVDTVVYAHINDYLFRSSDYGEHWDTVYAKFNHLFPFTMIDFRDELLVSSYELGVLRIDEPSGNLVQANEGMGKSYIFDMSYGAGKIWVTCGSGVFSFDVATQSWDEQMDVPYPTYVYSSISANDLGWVVVAKDGGDTLLLSKNEGEVWTKIVRGQGGSAYYFLGENLFDFTFTKVYRSTDSGATWEELFSHVQKNPVAFQGKNYIVGANSIYVTVDDGLTWDSIPNDIQLKQLYAYEDQAYGLTGDPNGYIQLFLSKDLINWTPAQNNFPQIGAFEFFEQFRAFFFRDAQNHYAFMAQDGAYTSPVDVIDWTPVLGVPLSTAFILQDTVLYAGSRGMYKDGIVNLYITGIQEPAIDNNFFTVSPNPARDITTIEIHSPADQLVKVELLSSSGSVLFSDKINPGENMLTIPVHNLIPGIYFITCTVDDLSTTKSFFKK